MGITMNRWKEKKLLETARETLAGRISKKKGVDPSSLVLLPAQPASPHPIGNSWQRRVVFAELQPSPLEEEYGRLGLEPRNRTQYQTQCRWGADHEVGYSTE